MTEESDELDRLTTELQKTAKLAAEAIEDYGRVVESGETLRERLKEMTAKRDRLVDELRNMTTSNNNVLSVYENQRIQLRTMRERATKAEAEVGRLKVIAKDVDMVGMAIGQSMNAAQADAGQAMEKVDDFRSWICLDLVDSLFSQLGDEKRNRIRSILSDDGGNLWDVFRLVNEAINAINEQLRAMTERAEVAERERDEHKAMRYSLHDYRGELEVQLAEVRSLLERVVPYGVMIGSGTHRAIRDWLAANSAAPTDGETRSTFVPSPDKPEQFGMPIEDLVMSDELPPHLL